MTYITLNESASTSLNYAINGGMEVWQRGTSFSNPAINTFTADRWKVSVNGSPSWSVTKDTSTFDTGLASMSVNVTSVGGATVFNIFQNIENYSELRGKTLTLSVRVKTTLANKIQVRIEQDAASAFSSFHSGSGNWETLTCTLTTNAGASQMDIQMGMVGNSSPVTGQWWFDSVSLTIGSSPVSYVPVDPALELQRCLRYYEAGLLEISALGRTGPSSYQIEQAMTFAAPKRINPTMTFGSVSVWEEGSVTNVVGSYTVNIIGVQGGNQQVWTSFTVAAFKSIAGSKPSFLSGNWTASAES